MVGSPGENESSLVRVYWRGSEYRGETWSQAFSPPMASVPQQVCLLQNVARGKGTETLREDGQAQSDKDSSQCC